MKLLTEFIAEIKKFGITKASKESGVSRNTIAQWVSGNNIPTIINAQRVASAMGLEFLLFCKLEDEENEN